MKKQLLTFLLLALLTSVLANAYSVYKIDGIYYYFSGNQAIVTNSGHGSPSPDDPYVGNVVIPDSVTWYGRTYPVTTIGLQAFNNSPNMTGVDIPATVTTCEFSAFSDCWGLERVNIHDMTAWLKMTFGNDWANPLFRGENLYLNDELVTDVDVPSSITEIKKFAFSGCRSLKHITLPNTITSIGLEAFAYCDSLMGIDIPNSVDTIASFAFMLCKSLKHLTLPDGITTIGQCTFDNCWALESLVIPESVTVIGDWAFRQCYDMASLTLPEGLVSIGEQAFEYSSITTLELPHTLTYIGSSAFAMNRQLSGLHIPSSVLTIGPGAFSFCNTMQYITVDSDNPNYDSRGDCNALIETSSNILLWGCVNTVIPNTVVAINQYAFERVPGLTSIDIPNSVISIGRSAFGYCPDLKYVTLGNSLATIGNTAFECCYELAGIDLPNSLTTIGEGGFRGCTKMAELNIGSSLDSIGTGAFSGCTGLSSIVVSGANPKYDSRDGCNALIETASNTLLMGSINAVIPGTVVHIGDKAFNEIKDIERVDIPGTVKTIGDRAFYGCGMKELTIGEGVTSIGNQAFRYCPEITSVKIPNSVTSVGSEAFYACNKLQEAVIGNGITTLPEKMIHWCGKMTKLTIGSSVDSIGAEAFNKCFTLTDVTCLAPMPPRAAPDAFYNYSGTLSVPVAAVSTYRATSPWSDFAEIVGIIKGGDLNGDGYLSISDVTSLVELILRGGNLPPYADVNGDGVVNISDVTAIIYAVLTNSNPGYTTVK